MDAINTIISNPYLFTVSCALFGLMVGSFLNVVIYRLPIMLERQWQQEAQMALSEGDAGANANDNAEAEPFNLVTPRSRCSDCGAPITAMQNIPVISFLMLGGKCANCKTSISWRYPLVEMITAILSAVVAWLLFPNVEAACAAVLLTWALIALTGIDYDTYLLPDNITLPLLWLGLIVNYFGLITSLESAFWGAVAGYLSLWSIFWAFKLLTGKEGMGYGDFKLLAALGAWLGWQMLPVIIILSSLVGAVVGISLMLFADHEKTKPIPFGPYLAAAGWLALLWGDTLNNLYLNYAGLA